MKEAKHDECKCSGNSIVRSKGEYTILATRNTFNINKTLPYPIWGTLYLQGQNFSTAVKDYLPDGITCTSAVIDSNIVLTYTDGIVTDTITVSTVTSSLLSYAEMLMGLNTAYLKTELCYFGNNTHIANTPLLTDQQNKILQEQPLYMSKIGGLGNKGNELITPLSRALPNNSVKDVLEISMRKQDIMPDTVWIHGFGYVSTTVPTKIRFYWQVIINDIVNMNKTAYSL